MRALAVFGIGVLIGTAIGRVLPALVVTVVVSLALLVGAELGRPFVSRSSSFLGRRTPRGSQF